MKISAKSRYGLRILLDIALHETPERPRLMRDICESQQISEKFTSRIVIPLRQKGMIHSHRGKFGGFRLAKAPADISLLDVIEAEDGPVSLIDCVASPDTCGRAAGCAARTVWNDVNAAVRLSLRHMTLETLIARVSPGRGPAPVFLEYCI